MIELLILLLLNSALIFGFHHATTYDGYEADDLGELLVTDPDTHEWQNVLWWFRYYLHPLPMWLKKPLFICENCMASVHSFIPYTLFIFESGYPDFYMLLWPGYVLALSGINSIIGKFIHND